MIIGFETQEGELHADCRCGECGKFLKRNDATVVVNGLGEVKRFEGLICAKHGEVQPVDWWWYG